ncbi:MAG TPA: PKD domain-containing protein, partial [Planctomycetota bacterium]|nr:PKD domain-containing protein [Planctomycetota bacterium]
MTSSLRRAAAIAFIATTFASFAAAQTPLGTVPLNVGTYEIDNNPASPNPQYPTGTRFNNWAEAKLELDSWGLAGNGDVVFDLIDNSGLDFTGSAVQMPWRPLVNAAGSWGNNAIFVFDEWTGASATSRVIIRSKPGGPRVVVDGGNVVGIGFFLQGGDFITIENLEIRNFTFDAISIYGETQMQTAPKSGVSNAVHVKRCLIHDNGGCGVMVYGNSARPANTVIENNWFVNNVKGSNDFFNDFGRFGHVTGRRNDTTTIRFNSFYQSVAMVNLNAAAQAGTGIPGCMIGNNNNTGTPFSVVSGNLFHIAGTGTVCAAGFFNYTAQGSVSNLPLAQDRNVCFDTSGTGTGTGLFGRWPAPAGVNFVTTQISGATTAAAMTNWQTTTGRDANSVYGDPLYSAPTSPTFDLSIPFNSPAVDLGPTGTGVIVDINNSPRVGASPDSGAFEAPLPGLTAAFSPSATSGAAAFTVTFTDQSSAVGVGAANSWSWDFENDGVPDSALQNPTHIYFAPGVYTVKLTVSNGIDTSSITLSNLITVGPYELTAFSNGVGDLTITGVPAIGAPGALTYYTLLSLTTTGPVGGGEILGITWDFLTAATVTWPLGVGDP